MSAPHLLYLAWGFPPAAKSCTYRLLATANLFRRQGWDVTVVTLTEEAWRREHGLDLSLSALVDPEIEVVRLPLLREDLETDIRTYPKERAQHPLSWLRRHRKEDEESFPEPVFGRWHDELVARVRELHEARPADLVLATAAPYTFFAPALDLHRRTGVPFVLDYRDAWAIDILRDVPAFTPDSRRGRIEAELMDSMHEAWFVNTPIRDAYAELYPARADDLHVVRNGSDLDGFSRPEPRTPDPDAGLTFGYLGTITFGADLTRAVCEGWRLARRHDPVLARSRLEFRGHVGAGAARGSNAHARIIDEFEEDGVSLSGPVPKARTPEVYAAWDALVLCLVGGKYVTSGKVYDYVATGLPVVSAHAPDHAAVEILRDYPLWVPNADLTPEALAEAFRAGAARVLEATPDERADAAAYARRFERTAQIEPAVSRLTAEFTGASA
ncbi:glycosyltransferase involved in cell wall biosynthesis [Knoellia remsis]|uniref:Glycosyltransferase involved in cell wall biosynthesis n=1 Tax=Knoellia remsis TaxID=407159 RepID=A0A2T0UD97_9MICO|nr:glycosyltransferase [Knoellia remsis]PRY55864.1 glycosyltransferase involved in cell wall biosynthesis [Knoellia remsis]